MRRRILFVRTDRMGDLLLSLPALHAVRIAWPQAEISLLVQRGLTELVEGHPDLDRVLPWDPQEPGGWGAILRWARRLRQERFDAVVILNPTKLFHAASFLARIPVRIGYRRKLGVLLTASIPDTKSIRNLHEAQYNLELVRLLGIKADSPLVNPSLPVTEKAISHIQDLLQSHGLGGSTQLLALHPWTSNRSKAWPLESFADFARCLKSKGREILLVGAESEDSWQSEERLRFDGVVDLVGQVPLGVLPALLRRCSLLISNDSGPVHVAASVGTPTLVVAPKEHGPLADRWRPLGNRHVTLLSPTVEEVAAAVCPLLAEASLSHADPHR